MNRHDLTIKEFAIAITITLFLAIGSFCLIDHWFGTDYQRDMVVVDVEENNIVVLQDINGFTWDCYAEGLKIGDTVIAYFNDNGTSETIFDDKVMNFDILCTSNY